MLVFELMVATRFTLLWPVTDWRSESLMTNVQLRVAPALTAWPLGPTPQLNVHVMVEATSPEVPAPQALWLFSFNKRTAFASPALVKFVEETAVPENVIEIVFKATDPALFAEKDNVASWSLETLPRPDDAPSGVAAKINVLRKTVCEFPSHPRGSLKQPCSMLRPTQ